MGSSWKVCLLGAAAVGKSSLVARVSRGAFSARYATTAAPRVVRVPLEVDGGSRVASVWDLSGEDAFHSVSASLLRGADAFVLVADGTRPATLDAALRLRERAERAAPGASFVLALNKADLEAQWAVDERVVAGLEALGWAVARCSARTGAGVAEAFARAARLAGSVRA